MDIIEAALAFVQDLFQDTSGSHDAAHTLRVYWNALRIASGEPPCDTELVALGALLHDADDPKLFRTENNQNARAFLDARGVSPARTAQILEIVNGVSFSKNRDKRPASPEGQIVQDADRLDAIGAVGIARAFAYGGEHGRSLEDTLKHFDEKLLLLKDRMNTETARALALERHAFLLRFLEEYQSETR